MMPGYGETLIVEGDPRLDAEREAAGGEFRRQLDEGMWAARARDRRAHRPPRGAAGDDFEEVPRRRRAGAVLAARRRRGAAPSAMGGVGVVLLMVTLAALAAVMRRPRGRRARSGARDAPPAPSWITEPPVSPAEAERRSLELLRSVVNPEEWGMFRELGFICVTGRRGRARRAGPDRLPRVPLPDLPPPPRGGAAAPLDGARCASTASSSPTGLGGDRRRSCPRATTCSPSG